MTGTPRVEDVLDYLRAHGWAMTGRWRSATVWSLREFDVLVPPSDTMADTAGRLRELVRCVADAEGRTPRAVGRDIALPAVDIVSYRAHDFAESIALPTGIRSLRAARDLVATCAREEGADSALLERTLLSLSEEVFGVDIALPYEDLGRRTALRVLHSSKAALSALESSEPIAGVSTEVSVALADLGRMSSFELGFRWSRLAPRADEAVTFPRGAGDRIRAATKRAERPVDGVGVVEGPVQRLADDENGERWRIAVRGVLQIDGTPAGRRRLVPVWLRSAEDYAAALDAHKAKRVVRVQGPVQGRGIAAADNGFMVTDRT